MGEVPLRAKFDYEGSRFAVRGGMSEFGQVQVGAITERRGFINYAVCIGPNNRELVRAAFDALIEQNANLVARMQTAYNDRLLAVREFYRTRS